MKRTEYADIAKAIAIFTVVLGHVNQATTPNHEWLYIDVCYAFHMPLFFMLSGFFIRCSPPDSCFPTIRPPAKSGISGVTTSPASPPHSC